MITKPDICDGNGLLTWYPFGTAIGMPSRDVRGAVSTDDDIHFFVLPDESDTQEIKAERRSGVRITLTFDDAEERVIRQMAEEDLRPPKDQIRIAIREAARLRGLWPEAEQENEIS